MVSDDDDDNDNDVFPFLKKLVKCDRCYALCCDVVPGIFSLRRKLGPNRAIALGHVTEKISTVHYRAKLNRIIGIWFSASSSSSSLLPFLSYRLRLRQPSSHPTLRRRRLSRRGGHRGAPILLFLPLTLFHLLISLLRPSSGAAPPCPRSASPALCAPPRLPLSCPDDDDGSLTFLLHNKSGCPPLEPRAPRAAVSVILFLAAI